MKFWKQKHLWCRAETTHVDYSISDCIKLLSIIDNWLWIYILEWVCRNTKHLGNQWFFYALCKEQLIYQSITPNALAELHRIYNSDIIKLTKRK